MIGFVFEFCWFVWFVGGCFYLRWCSWLIDLFLYFGYFEWNLVDLFYWICWLFWNFDWCKYDLRCWVVDCGRFFVVRCFCGGWGIGV